MKQLKEILKEASKLPFRSLAAITVTPQIAIDLLELDADYNRTTPPHAKKALMQAMIDKEWHFNGDTIRFCREGDRDVLIDGKTRLLACRDSGISFDAILIWDLTPEAVATIDIGRKRQLFQIIHMLGKPGNTSIASAATMIYAWLHSEPPRVPNHSEYVQPYQLQEAFDLYPLVISEAAYEAARRLHRKFQIVKPGVGIAAFALIGQSNAERAETIFTALYSGEEIHRKILFRFRERLIDETGRGKQTVRDEMLKRFVFVSNLMAEGRDVNKFPSLEVVLKTDKVI